MSESLQHIPLLDDTESNSKNFEHQHDCVCDREYARRTDRHIILLWFWITLQVIIIVCLVGIIFIYREGPCPADRCENIYPQGLYSPAMDIINYEPHKFAMGFKSQKTNYQGEPSDEIDQAWSDLYNEFGFSQIAEEQARLLPNETLSIPGDEGSYAIGLTVFYELRCLNLIRKGLHAEYYTDPQTGTIAGIPKEDWPEHMDYCIDAIRQSVMCSADISPVVWQWGEDEERAMIRFDTMHSCRDFNSIVGWAKEHQRTVGFDERTHVVDDIEIRPGVL